VSRSASSAELWFQATSDRPADRVVGSLILPACAMPKISESIGRAP
jgi:hypothetical protein